jgi:hypothetical protein
MICSTPTIAHEEMHNLQDEIQNLKVTGDNDEWKLTWGDYYSIREVYKCPIGQHETPESILNIWKTCSVPRHIFLPWLLLQKSQED